MSRADARTRLKTARMYLTAAELIVDEAAEEAATVATGNAVLGLASRPRMRSAPWHRGSGIEVLTNAPGSNVDNS